MAEIKSQLDAVFLREVDGAWVFLVQPAYGPWYGVRLHERGIVCVRSGQPAEGMPMHIRVSTDGKRLLNWKYRGVDEPGFDFQTFLEKNGLTYETRERRLDVDHWLEQVK